MNEGDWASGPSDGRPEHHRGLGSQALAPPGEAHLFGGGGLEAHGVYGHFQQFRYALLHGLTVGLQTWGFCQQGKVRVTHHIAA